MPGLFDSLQIGDLVLPHRIVMAPMTRNRANSEGVQPPMVAEYYAQRASAGLIITEATQVEPHANGYINTPGIYTPEQIDSWKPITQAVHDKGGRIYMQLWHAGAISHTSLHPGGESPLSPSGIRQETGVFTVNGPEPVSDPRALMTEEVKALVGYFKQAARNAKEVGFDGVEIHGANGYLIDQFLRDSTNQRTDEYGGTIENRHRFLLEIVEASVDVWGPDCVGVRISPRGVFNDIKDSQAHDNYGSLAKKLNEYPLAFLHLIEAVPNYQNLAMDPDIPPILDLIRDSYEGALIINGGYDKESGDALIQSGKADLVAYGALYISNPDLLERFKAGAKLTPPDRDTFYVPGEKGYIDYPFMQ